jgi:hypothetical protein
VDGAAARPVSWARTDDRSRGGFFAGKALPSRILVNTTATDPWTFAAITLLLTVVAVTACIVPRGGRCEWIRWSRFGRSDGVRDAASGR